MIWIFLLGMFIGIGIGVFFVALLFADGDEK